MSARSLTLLISCAHRLLANENGQNEAKIDLIINIKLMATFLNNIFTL